MGGVGLAAVNWRQGKPSPSRCFFRAEEEKVGKGERCGEARSAGDDKEEQVRGAHARRWAQRGKLVHGTSTRGACLRVRTRKKRSPAEKVWAWSGWAAGREGWATEEGRAGLRKAESGWKRGRELVRVRVSF
jgi:hypothetical protein